MESAAVCRCHIVYIRIILPPCCHEVRSNFCVVGPYFQNPGSTTELVEGKVFIMGRHEAAHSVI